MALRLTMFLTGAYIVLCGALFLAQRSLLYSPPPRTYWGPTLTLPIPNQRILIATRLVDGPRAVVYYGSKAEEVASNLAQFSQAFPADSLYLLHYRGYSGSSGSPSEQALVSDALVLYDLARQRHEKISILGRSLGTGVAIQVASQRQAERLVLVTPYDSVQDVAERRLPFVPVSLLLIDKYESWRYVEKISAPTLIIAAEHDEIIPRASTDKLRARFRNTFVVIPGTGHNDISNSEKYWQALSR